MSLYFTWKESIAMESHAALTDGLLVDIGTSVGQNGIAKTAAPAAGGTIAGVTVVRNAKAAGDITDVVTELGVIVPMRVSAAVAVGAELAAGADMKAVTAGVGDVVIGKALQAAGATDEVISVMRVASYVKA